MHGLVRNLVGQTFGRLEVVKDSGRRVSRGVVWLCRCSCKEKPLVEVMSSHLTGGKIRSCGCLRRELASAAIKHGANRRNKKRPMYKVWQHMKDRCYNPNNEDYARYGGRGITVCPEWLDNYSAFERHMLSLPNCPKNILTYGTLSEREIDRYPDNNGNYEPSNVRWATRKEQMNNMSRNRMVKAYGARMSLSTAIEKHAVVPYDAVYSRLERGWPLKKAMLTPRRTHV